MKYLAVCVSLALLAALAEGRTPEQFIQEFKSNVNQVAYEYQPYDHERGTYRYAYQLSDRTRHEQRGELKNKGLPNEHLAVIGEYSYIAPNGVRYIIKYVADDQGYQPEIEEEPPGAPPPPPPTIEPSPFEILNAFLSR